MNGISGAGGAGAYGASGLSTDDMIAYCRAQLSGIDDEIDTFMNQQQSAMNERTVLNNLKSTLEQYGTEGPNDKDAMQKCYDAYKEAIASLPPGDPVAQQLAAKCDKLKSDYGFTPEHVEEGTYEDGTPYQADVGPSLDNPPKDGAWKATLDDLDGLAESVKSGAEIQLLQLNSLVAQRQQAVELSSGMLSKFDQTLFDEVRAIGQG